MKVLLVDDHPLFLEGLQNLLEARGLEVVGTASDGLEALEKARTLRPDLILMDIQMPRCDGLTATRLIRAEFPWVRIVMLTVSEEDEDLFEAIKCGASGYLLKSLDAAEFFQLLSNLERDEPPLSPGIVAKILAEFARQAGEREAPPSEEEHGLTPRQVAVLSLVAQGMTYREVGKALHLTERTVKYHMARILERLHARTRAEAIAYASRKGLLPSRRPSNE